MRTLLLGALALALLAPAVSAQAGTQYHVTMSLVPPEHDLREHSTLVTLGRIDVIGDPTMMLNLQGLRVQYAITAAPSWAAVVVEPAADVIPLAFSGGLSVTGSRAFSLSILAADPPAATEVGLIEITATIAPDGPLAHPKTVSQAIPVRYQVEAPEEGHEDCDEAEAYAAALLQSSQEADEPAAPAPEDDLVVQTGGATPVATWYAVGGFALAGAAAGFALLRRLSR